MHKSTTTGGITGFVSFMVLSLGRGEQGLTLRPNRRRSDCLAKKADNQEY